MLTSSAYPLVIFAGPHAPFARHHRSIGMETISNDQFNELIFVIRGRKVMLSFHLAPLYGVEVRVLAQAVKRNSARFPEDFMFQLTSEEVDCLRSQNVILKTGKRGQNIKYLPYAFTQEGIAMLSGVLSSERAILVNIAIMRTFVKLRELMSSQRELAQKIDSLERRYDGQFQVVFNSIRKLIDAQPTDLVRVPPTRRTIGFGREQED